jgi:aminopeptidase N
MFMKCLSRNAHFTCLGIATALLSLTVLAAPTREDRDDLTREMAQFRRAQIDSVSYTLDFTLQKKADSFAGRATLHVKLNDATAPLSIDLTARSVDEVAVNGKVIEEIVKRGGSFDIPAEHLTLDPMDITVDYTGAYSETGEGLCHFNDPVDDKEYLYTNLEPYGAHKVFPCFDQPDIKATYTMTVNAPEAWVVIGNMQTASKELKGETQRVAFKPTPPLSTYLFFLGGGGYQAWHDSHNGMPLTMYARASMAKHFDAERLFAETKAGLDYFNAFFDFPYPFDKYDHVFAPELGPGAMENPGAVTMNEYMIFRGAAKAEDYRDRNNVLLHEMAHMWFGDLVTMAWWNDLWLNESFATFSSYLAQHSMTEDPAIWQDFYGMKGWAYYQDQLSTTHPIEVEVPSAMLAMDNFDGITYAKGASALKQLWFKVGPEAYQKGVAAYFKQFAWQNATRAQFMDAIADASGVDLDAWTETWLKTAGLSQVAVEYVCEEDTIKNFVIEQSAVNAPLLSPHRTQLAFFNRDATGKLFLGEVLPADFAAARTELPSLVGKSCPDFVYPNFGDMDYGLFFLDPHSYETVLNDLAALEDPFLRRMVWGTLYAMVRQERLRASEFMTLVLANLPKETNLGVLEYLLGGRMLNETLYHFLTPEHRDEVAPRLEEVLWAGRARAEAASDERLLWHDAAVSLAARPDAMERLRPLLDSGTLDQPRRWNVVGKLAQLGAPDAEALADAELQRDPTDQGERIAFGVRGSIPTVEAKESQWKRLTDPELPLSRQRAGAGSFHNPFHPELSQLFVDGWFEAVRSMDWEAEQHRIGIWFDSLIPPLYTPEFLARSRKALASAQLPPRARRAWQESNDQIERVIAIRAYDNRSNDTP